MGYQIKLEPKAEKALNSLPLEITERIIERLQEAQENPFHYLEKLKGMPEFKLRVGDYRAIILADSSDKILKVQAVGHRKNIYKKYKIN